jgi:glutathione S-transferase
MLTIHHLTDSRSDRLIWLCEELNIPYHLVVYQRDPITHLGPPEFKKLHPFASAPVVTDGDLVLGESAAIVDYIIETYGNDRLKVPAGDKLRPEYLLWTHFATGSIQTAMMMDMAMREVGGTGDSALVGAFRKQLDNCYNMVEARLGKVPFLVGSELTAADILTVHYFTTMRILAPRSLAAYPNLKAYLQRIAERPAFRKAMELAQLNYRPMIE